MSGFLAFVQTDGSPVDGPLLERLTESLAYCGPDHRATWVDGQIGLGHALLASAPNPPADQWQPAELDDRLWIVADARVDGRAELIRSLRSGGHPVGMDTPDARLILHAYDAWGDGCLDHLIGDFAFAIWDRTERRLFCARDHFGIVPLYYAEFADGYVLGNVLWGLRGHPEVSDALDEVAIGDFLLFGMNLETTTTTFLDIRSVPAAHALVIERGQVRVRRYWEAPPDNVIRLPRREDYVEHFSALFEQAVGDRLRASNAGAQLSGGMDSTSIAATAAGVLRARGDDFDLRAYTISYEGLARHDEPAYAADVAALLDIPLERLTMVDYMRRPPEEGWSFPEPLMVANQSVDYEVMSRVASFSRNLLCGLGGDPLLEARPSLPKGIAEWRDRIGFAWEMLASGHVPRVGVRSALRSRFRRRPPSGWPHQMPSLSWIDADFARRMKLAERWREVVVRPPGATTYGTSSFGDLLHPTWPALFSAAHPGAHGLPTRFLFPFFDMRLARFVRQTPPYPWRQSKRLLRDAMQGRLPESVLRRPKTPMFGGSDDVNDDPRVRLWARPETREWRRRLLAEERIREYVDVEKALGLIDSPVPGVTSSCFAHCFPLAHWLSQTQPAS